MDPSKEGSPSKVSEYIDHTSAAWNVQKLEEFVLAMDVEVIRGIPLCTRNQHDFWAWYFEKTVIFTVRSAYRVLANTKKMREDWLDGQLASSGL
jgi:hypothetical protein